MRNSIDIAQRAVVIAALALFGLGCESDAPSGGKLSRAGEAGAGAEPIPATTSGAPEGRPGHSSRQDEEELEGLRKRMAIRQHIPADIGECTMGTCPDVYVCRDPVSDPVCVRPCSRGCGPQQACMSNGECGDVTLSEHIAPPGLPLGVVNHCQWLMKDHPLCGVEAERTECANFVLCSSITFSCAAHMALDMAGLRSEPVVLRDSTGAIVSEVPPQSSASNVTLAAQGAFYLASVYQYILTRAGLEDEDWECNAEEAQLLATNLVEAFHLANEASDVGIDNMLAVADSIYAEMSSRAVKA